MSGGKEYQTTWVQILYLSVSHAKLGKICLVSMRHSFIYCKIIQYPTNSECCAYYTELL